MIPRRQLRCGVPLPGDAAQLCCRVIDLVTRRWTSHCASLDRKGWPTIQFQQQLSIRQAGEAAYELQAVASFRTSCIALAAHPVAAAALVVIRETVVATAEGAGTGRPCQKLSVRTSAGR
uniref:Uncharacterized protein n=1 Tax=Cupriavidus taiwanensis TaxID=164546 RepID=A0A375HCI9_9BURK|nr:protein of unknown function [Cupriavidus taiwanensis]